MISMTDGILQMWNVAPFGFGVDKNEKSKKATMRLQALSGHGGEVYFFSVKSKKGNSTQSRSNQQPQTSVRFALIKRTLTDERRAPAPIQKRHTVEHFSRTQQQS